VKQLQKEAASGYMSEHWWKIQTATGG